MKKYFSNFKNIFHFRSPNRKTIPTGDKDSIVEIFVKEKNGDALKESENIEYHLSCSLLSILCKKDFHKREYISINDIKKKIKKLEDEELPSDDIIIDLIRKKFKFSKDKPFTIIWRVDEAQNIIFDLTFEDKHKTVLYKYMIKMMSFMVENAGTSTFFIPIISGISDRNILKLMPSSNFKTTSIPLYISDISLETAYKLIIDETNNENILKIANFEKFLQSLGLIKSLKFQDQYQD